MHRLSGVPAAVLLRTLSVRLMFSTTLRTFFGRADSVIQAPPLRRNVWDDCARWVAKAGAITGAHLYVFASTRCVTARGAHRRRPLTGLSQRSVTT